jgi:hypothetical protein
VPIEPSPRARARRTRRLAALIGLALVAAACTRGDSTGSPSATGPVATLGPDELGTYRDIAAEVVAIRGLDAPDRVEPRVIDAAELRANLEADFDASNSDGQVLIAERVYKALGLLPTDADLRAFYLDMQGSQVIGYYDLKVNELFIVSRSGALGPTERVTYAHEFTHELQDLHFDLESLGLDTPDQGDRALAVLGLVEGDAVSAQTTWMTEHLSAEELAQVAAEALDPEMLEILAQTPPILLETALFPYQAGAAFVDGLIAGGGYDKVNAAFDDLPASTEQILHPTKYRAREEPIEVALPADLAARLGEGWKLDAQDTLGELQLRIWLREGDVAGDVAREAVEGWGGDRVALLAAPEGDGDVVIMVTVWDTRGDAVAFQSAAEDLVDGRATTSSVVASGRRVVVAIGDIGSRGNDLLDELARD